MLCTQLRRGLHDNVRIPHNQHSEILYVMIVGHVPRQVNADDHRDIGERFGVRGFPTIKFFGRGKPVTAPEEYAPTREHL